MLSVVVIGNRLQQQDKGEEEKEKPVNIMLTGLRGSKIRKRTEMNA
jgi:hypothetical protein